MNLTRWEHVQALFHDAASRPRTDQRAFLEAACGGDPTLVDEVIRMLEADAGASLLDRGVADAAGDVVRDGIPPGLAEKRFGPYRLTRALGEGGMGVVYRAVRDDLGSVAAIKILRDAWLSPARRERFSAEQRLLAQLNYPSIARLYDADTLEDGTPWFAMEFVEGVPITEHCRSLGQSLNGRLDLFRDVCEAVQHAHQNLVIHRDLKPSNILVTRAGRVKLLDFGISKQLENLDGLAEPTRTGFRLMTPAYAAPEQIRGERTGLATDVYQLGVVLYELLAGRLPVDLVGRSAGEVERLLLEGEPAKPSSASASRAAGGDAAAAVPAATRAEWADLDVLCLTAMHKDQKRRYRTVDALIRDVQNFQAGQPLLARPDSVRYRAGKFVRRNARPVGAAAAILLVLIGLSAFYTVRLAAARNAAQAERDRANHQTAIVSAINRFLADDLLGRSNPFQSSKSDTTLVEALKQASPDIDRQFGGAPDVAARLHHAVARALDNRSEFSGARARYDRAAALFATAEGELSQNAIAAALQRAAMEARSYEAGSLPRARAILAEQESRIARLKDVNPDIPVWLASARGMIGLIGDDAKTAVDQFQRAYELAGRVPTFDEAARLTLKQRLAFAHIRQGDGRQAEQLFRELIEAFSRLQGPESPSVLRVRLNLAQAFMIQNKHRQAVDETTAIYPAYVASLGEDNELAMQVLTTRAQSEGSLGWWEPAIRDDLHVHDLAVRKQGPLSFFALATLSDAALAQCRAGRYRDGEGNARRAFEQSGQAFGPRAGLTGGAAYTLSVCDMGLDRLDEAGTLLDGINVEAVAQLSGTPDWPATIELSRAEIAYRRGDSAAARALLKSATPMLTRPEADPFLKQSVERLAEALTRHST